MKIKILITGSTGFVGKKLVRKLIQEGYNILEVTRDINKSKEIFGESTDKLEVNDVDFKSKIMSFKPNIVVHLASILTSSDNIEDIKNLVTTNLMFFSILLDSVSSINLKLFINTGTSAEYGSLNHEYQPAYFYAATKTASRSILDYYSVTYKFKQTTVVPYTIYGENDSQKKIINLIIDSTKSKNPIDLSPGKQVLDFIHVDDVVKFYLLLIKNSNKLSNKTNFKLGTGSGYNLKELANKIETLSNNKTNINWGGKDYRPSDIMYSVADLSEIKKYFDWRPKISLDEGLKKMLKINQ